MEDKFWPSIEELHNHALNTVDKQVKELVSQDSMDRYIAKPKNKGWVGNSIESDWFGIANNNRKEADVPNLNLEIKVTPLIKTKVGWSAKERLSLNIFDFNDEHKHSFENSSFMKKANLIELIHYEYTKETESPEYYIKAATLFDLNKLPEKDLLIIKEDWKLIVNKIKEGKAEELSDSLTKYLGATTKGGKTESNKRTQPFSDIEAHQRAFTLKGSYMTMIARQIMPVESKSKKRKLSDEKIIKDIEVLKEKTFEQIIFDKFKPYVGWSKKELSKEFGINIPEKNDKASSRLLARKMLNVAGNIEDTDEFKKSGIAVQIVTVKTGSKRTTEGFKINVSDENYLRPVELVTEDWEDATLNEYLSSHQYLLVIYERTELGDKFKGVKFWRMPLHIIEKEVKEAWLDAQNKFKNGLNLTYKKWGNSYRIQNELPKIKSGKAVYINTSSSKSSYTKNSNATKVPTKNKWFDIPENKKDSGKFSDYYCTKLAWWINPNYMYEQVKELIENKEIKNG